jgi:hypothetical protein
MRFSFQMKVLLGLVLLVVPASSRADSADPLRVLLMGSSSMKGAMGMALEQELATWEDVVIMKRAESATGLARPDYFDWMAEARTLAKSAQPDVVLCNLGPNDAQGLKVGSGWYIWGTDEWREAYQDRVRMILAAFEGIPFYWIGPPAMRRKNTSLRQALLSIFIANVARDDPDATFIDLHAMTSDANGRYKLKLEDQDGRKIKARSGDGIHFKLDGARIIARHVLHRIAADLKAAGRPMSRRVSPESR